MTCLSTIYLVCTLIHMNRTMLSFTTVFLEYSWFCHYLLFVEPLLWLPVKLDNHAILYFHLQYGLSTNQNASVNTNSRQWRSENVFHLTGQKKTGSMLSSKLIPEYISLLCRFFILCFLKKFVMYIVIWRCAW